MIALPLMVSATTWAKVDVRSDTGKRISLDIQPPDPKKKQQEYTIKINPEGLFNGITFKLDPPLTLDRIREKLNQEMQDREWSNKKISDMTRDFNAISRNSSAVVYINSHEPAQAATQAYVKKAEDVRNLAQIIEEEKLSAADERRALQAKEDRMRRACEIDPNSDLCRSLLDEYRGAKVEYDAKLAQAAASATTDPLAKDKRILSDRQIAMETKTARVQANANQVQAESDFKIAKMDFDAIKCGAKPKSFKIQGAVDSNGGEVVEFEPSEVCPGVEKFCHGSGIPCTYTDPKGRFSFPFTLKRVTCALGKNESDCSNVIYCMQKDGKLRVREGASLSEQMGNDRIKREKIESGTAN